MTPPDGPGAPAVRTFKRRASRVTTGQRSALDRLWATYGLPVDGRALDLPALFGREAPVVLEIGFGMGEATAVMAAAQPDRDLLAVDVHTPGHGNLLRLVEAAALTNVRLADGDAVLLLRDMLPAASLAAVRAFFPDPWPKSRHHKRRLVTAAFLRLCTERLVEGGTVHVATDDASYAAAAAAALRASPGLDVLPTAPWRAPTRFEGQAVAAGRSIHEVAAARRLRT